MSLDNKIMELHNKAFEYFMAHGSIVAPKKMGDGMIEAYSYIRNMPIQDVYNVFDGVSQGEKDSRYQDSKSQKERIEQEVVEYIMQM